MSDDRLLAVTAARCIFGGRDSFTVIVVVIVLLSNCNQYLMDKKASRLDCMSIRLGVSVLFFHASYFVQPTCFVQLRQTCSK